MWGDISPEKVATLIKTKVVGPGADGEGTVDGAPGGGKDFPLVPNGHVWRAGANEATKFTVSDDVLVNGQKLPAGAYSLYVIPGKDEFTIVFNKTADQWGSFSYDVKQDALRVKVKPVWLNDSQEQLLYDLPTITANSARAILRWERISVPFTIEAPNQDTLARSKIEAAIATNPSDWQIPFAVATAYARDGRFDDALVWVDKSLKLKETFQNLSAKANLLSALGRKTEAIAVGEQAVTRGKADGANTTRFEKFLSDLKAGKM